MGVKIVRLTIKSEGLASLQLKPKCGNKICTHMRTKYSQEKFPTGGSGATSKIKLHYIKTYANNKTEHLYTSHKTISTDEQYQHIVQVFQIFS